MKGERLSVFSGLAGRWLGVWWGGGKYTSQDQTVARGPWWLQHVVKSSDIFILSCCCCCCLFYAARPPELQHVLWWPTLSPSGSGSQSMLPSRFLKLVSAVQSPVMITRVIFQATLYITGELPCLVVISWGFSSGTWASLTTRNLRRNNQDHQPSLLSLSLTSHGSQL